MKGQDQTFDMTCLGALAAYEVIHEVIHQGDRVFQWFQATCQEGGKAWFELDDFIQRAGKSAKNAQITDYGSVQEY